MFRACRQLGLKTVAVFSEADRGALHVRDADEAVAIGGAPARESYLNAERILAAARHTRADAIHPGYGFLSESWRFADAVHRAGIEFVGPRPVLIDTLSFETYVEGEPWVAYRQFCQHFLAPLAVMSLTDLEHLDPAGLKWAQAMVVRHHYRRTPVPLRASPEGWGGWSSRSTLGSERFQRSPADASDPPA